MENNPNNSAKQELVTVCDIQFRNGTKIYYFDPVSLTVKAGDEVIIDTARGPIRQVYARQPYCHVKRGRRAAASCFASCHAAG